MSDLPVAPSAVRTLLVERPLPTHESASTPAAHSHFVPWRGGARVPYAIRIDGNPLTAGSKSAAGDAAAFDPWTGDSARRAGTIVGWSGTLAPTAFADEPRNWLPPGRRAFDASMSMLMPALQHAGVRLLLQPHARHALNDIPSVLTLMRRMANDAIGIALSPTALLTTSMLDSIEEHLQRILAALGPIAALLIVDDVRRPLTSDDGDDPLPESVPLGTGLVPAPLLRALIDAHVGITVPIAIGPFAGDAADAADAAERWFCR